VDYYFSERQKKENIKKKVAQRKNYNRERMGLPVDEDYRAEKRSSFLGFMEGEPQHEENYVLTMDGWKEYTGIGFSDGSGYQGEYGDKPIHSTPQGRGNYAGSTGDNTTMTWVLCDEMRCIKTTENGMRFSFDVDAEGAERVARQYKAGISPTQMRDIKRLIDGFIAKGVPLESLVNVIKDESERLSRTDVSYDKLKS